MLIASIGITSTQIDAKNHGDRDGAVALMDSQSGGAAQSAAPPARIESSKGHRAIHREGHRPL